MVKHIGALRTALLLFLILPAIWALLGWARTTPLERLGRKFYDLQASFHGLERQLPGDIVLVLAGEPSIARLGEWPWPRQTHARLLRRLAGARLVVMDILFPEFSTSENDTALVAAVRDHGRVVLSSHIARFGGGEVLMRPFPDLERYALATGFTNVEEDIDGVIRYAAVVREVDGTCLPSLALSAASQLAGGETEVADQMDGTLSLALGEARIRLDRRGNLWPSHVAGEFQSFEYADVLEGYIPAHAFEGRTVVVGVSAAGASDFHVVPDFFDSRVIAGARFQSAMVSSLLAGDGFFRPDRRTGMVMAGVFSLLGVIAAVFMRPVSGAVFAALLGAGLAVGVSVVFHTLRIWVDGAVPMLALLGSYAPALFARQVAMHRDWELKSFSIDRLHDLGKRDFRSYDDFASYMDSLWKGASAQFGIGLVQTAIPERDLDPEDRKRFDPGRMVVYKARSGPWRRRMLVPLDSEGERRAAVFGYNAGVSDEVLKTLSVLTLSAFWFFQALEESRKRKELLFSAIQAVFTAIDFKDPITGGHSTRVSEIVRQVLERLDIDRTLREDIYLGSIIHDVGKIGIPDAVLNKPDKLTDEEFGVIRSHPGIGRDIMQKVGLPEETLRTMFEHHERYDGKGYPGGLRGEDISLGARIVAVADVFDALLSDRPYRKGLDFDSVCEHLRKNGGKHFDPAIVEVLLGIVCREEK